MPSVYPLPMKFKGSQPWWDHPTLLRGTWIISLPARFCVSVLASVIFCLHFCVNSWGSHILPNYTNWCKCPHFILVSRIGYFLHCIFRCDFAVMHNMRNRISTALCQRGFLAWLWATAWVWFSGWFVLVYSSWFSSLSQMPPVIISGFIALRNICAHQRCSAGPILWFTL